MHRALQTLSIIALSKSTRVCAPKVFVAFVGLLFFTSGCGATFPKAPKVKTQQGRECLRTCQKKYNLWTRKCTGTDIEAPSRESCMSDCIEDLESCYLQCAEEEKTKNIAKE